MYLQSIWNWNNFNEVEDDIEDVLDLQDTAKYWETWYKGEIISKDDYEMGVIAENVMLKSN